MRNQSVLIAERDALRSMLDDIPIEDVIDRGGLQAKLDAVTALLAHQAAEREPARAKLTFVGRPVIGTRGIFADFGMKAVNGFTEAIAAIAASLTAPLNAMGPIPGRDQHQLLITNTARGSFGFELEEIPNQVQLPLDESSLVEQALGKTQALFAASAGIDDEALAEAVSEVDPRALDRIRSFMSTLVEYEAACALQLGSGGYFRFDGPGQIRRSLERLSAENVHEKTSEIRGWFEGVLPNKRRTFEFRLESGKDVIVGRLGPAVKQPELINQHLNKLCTISVSVTSVGKGRPKYVLLSEPQWDSGSDVIRVHAD